MRPIDQHPSADHVRAELEEKVLFLSRADSWPEKPTEVEAIETHMAWVFLTRIHAWKMKKPVRRPFLDFSSIEKRLRDCREEVRLNRRLAPGVYLGTTPLTRRPDGALEVRGSGVPVEWLVRMRRLPADRFLDHAIRDGTWTKHDVEKVARRLATFYRSATAEPTTPRLYRDRVRQQINDDRAALLDEPAASGHHAAVQRLTEALLRFVDARADLFDARVGASRIIEAHGDLRPEHVVLTDPPVIIDCLEFNRSFRILDPLDELAYFGLECERLGAAEVGEIVIRCAADAMNDLFPEPLVAFHGCQRALLRAKIALWHVGDDHVADPDRWLRRVADYIGLAERCMPALTSR